MHEPLNLEIEIGVNPTTPQYWYQYISEHNAESYVAAYREILSYEYPLSKCLNNSRSLLDIARISSRQGTSLLNKVSQARPVVKDPLAFFSAEWLSNQFNMQVLMLIRHPAAFCSSLKIKNWTFDFMHFTNQPELMERYLTPFKSEILAFAGQRENIIEQAILLWNCIHHVAKFYQEIHQDWYCVRHEDLSLDPLNNFKTIFSIFGLEFTLKSEKAILESTGSHNPTEQVPGNEFVRDSKANVKNWKRRLSEDEIELIKQKTFPVWTSFYTESDW